MPMRYEWDPVKAAQNPRKHCISFEFAAEILEGPTLDGVDARKEHSETRFTAVGFARGQEVFVAYTEDAGAGVRRIISARRANRKERQDFWTATRND